MRWPSWLRRRTVKTVRTRPFDEGALPEPAAPTAEQSLEEGMLLAEYATRMAVKNHIVVDTIQYGHDFDPARHTAEAAAMLRELASEQGEAAGRIEEELAQATGMRGDARHPHDYRDVDVANLQLRHTVALALADALRAEAESEDELLRIVERSRQDAWDEVSRAIEEAHLLAQITRLGRLSALERIADLFLELYERLSLAGLASNGRFALPLTQEVVADALGLTSVHLSRTLQLARRRGEFEWRDGQVILHDLRQLGRMVGRLPVRVSNR